MRKIFITIMLFVFITGNAFATVSLPELGEVYGQRIPRLGNAIRKDVDLEKTDINGNITHTYNRITDNQYSVISDYLQEHNCKMIEYHITKRVLTAQFLYMEHEFTIIYDAPNGILEVIYPDGTYPEDYSPVQKSTYTHAGLSKDSDSEYITDIQKRLYMYGLLNIGKISIGTLDYFTLEAIKQFQIKANETLGVNLTIIDPSIADFIDAETIDILMSNEGF